ncbi:MAG: exonuclease subunit SbcD [Rhodothermales bacterium]
MKILHTADIHLGSNTYGRIDPETGLNTRLLDFKRCFEFMVQRGLDEGIDVFLFCGDAYRTADPTPTQQKVFAECLKPISDAGIPIIMVTGNHDHPVSFGKASAIDIFSYISGEVHLFRKPATALIQTKSGPLQLLAMPWPIRSMLLSRGEYRKKSPLEIREIIEHLYVTFIQNAVEEFDPALPTVLAGHFSVQGSEISGSERTSLIAHEPKFTPGQLSPPPIDYVALGHIHRFQDRRTDPEAPPVVYCSSLERITFKESGDRKGFVLVTIEAHQGRKETTYEFVDTPARRFLTIQVDARDAVDPTETILRAIAGEEVEDAIVRVRYHIEEAQVAQINTSRLREALQTACVIASIERTVDPVERQRRTVLTRESSLQEAMERYIAQHDHLASIKDDLLRAALDLEAAYEARRREES